MIKLDMTKVMNKQPWGICLVWNLAVLTASLGMVLHADNYYWIFLCVLISWPSEDE